VLLRAGIIGPLWRPFRALRQLGLISRWGPSLAGVFQSAAARDPGRTAVVDERGSLTYTELDELSSRLANGMAGLDIRAGDRVMMLCRNHSTMLATMIAASKIGADLVLLNSHLTGPMLIQAVREHRPAALFSDDEFATVAKVVPGDVLRISTWREHGHRGITVDQLIKDAEPGRPRRPRHPGRIILQTAGTTGPPRSYYRTLPRGRGLGTASVVLSAIPHRVHDHMLLTTPLFHVWGFNAMQLGMALRGTLVLRRGHEPETLLADVDKHKCDTVYVRHDLLQRMLDLPADVRARYDISAIRIIVSAGSVPGPMARRVMSKFGDILYHIYGASEVTWGTIARPEDLRVAPATAGVPPPGTRIAILDSSGDPVPPGSIGRIFVGNEMVFSGYTDGSMPDTFDKLLDTGDHGYLAANGRLFVAGRDGEQIVSRGEIFYTRAVEEVIAALPQVEQVAVVGLSSTEYTQRLAAHVVLRPGAQLEVEALWHHVHERLGRAAVPRDVYFVDRLPVTSTGTVMKRMLRTGMFPVQGGQAHLPRP